MRRANQNYIKQLGGHDIVYYTTDNLIGTLKRRFPTEVDTHWSTSSAGVIASSK
jgi:hypothetical protein